LQYFPYFQRPPIKKNGIKIKDVYRFVNDFNDAIVVEVFYYEYNVYAIKFYLKKHRHNRDKYSVTYPQDFKTKKSCPTGNENFLKTLNTILKISLKIMNEDNLASFGFMGAAKSCENDEILNSKNINPDGTIANTKRYKVYLLYVKRFFGPETFEYIDSKTSSILLLRNNRNKEKLTEKVAEKYIIATIIPSL
jgi:hypothetical protein